MSSFLRTSTPADPSDASPCHAGLPLAGRRGLWRASWLAAAMLILGAAPSLATELGAAAVPTRNQIVIHDAAETLRDWCRPDGRGGLRLQLPGGASFELVTSVTDTVIANRGDGAFHSFALVEVRAALAAVRYPLAGIAADVFILPYPRREGLCSAAGPGLILLSPGVYPLPASQQHSEFLHELGHVVQYARLPDRSVSEWDRYRALRGISDASVYSASAPHADRPHEIFAEDFRALFGDPLACANAGIENPTLVPPAQVPGLATFLLELPVPPAEPVMSVRPNPARGPLVFSASGWSPALLDVFDVAGRRLVTLRPETTATGVRWLWDGLDEAGHRVGPGVVFARARGARASSQAPAPALRVTLLP